MIKIGDYVTEKTLDGNIYEVITINEINSTLVVKLIYPTFYAEHLRRMGAFVHQVSVNKVRLIGNPLKMPLLGILLKDD